MTAREEALPNRPTKLGRYELITRIGQGGMAEVQLAIQRGPAGFEKLVVVKLVHENLATQKTFVDMLLDEARVAALVKHPNVVDIYDLGEVDGRYYIAMEYLEGEPLLSVLRAGREGKRLDVMSTARLIADTAEGLDAAHELKSLGGERLELVHHDVSLGNIVVLYTGQVKLVDFGVAKATQSAATRNKVQGKFSYMAPEKMRGEAGDRRSDIFSLGCVLWESLTLKRLFRGGNDTETMKQVLESVIVPPSQINPDVPDELDPIVMRALEREPEYRYATAAALAADLEEVLRAHAYPRRNDAIAKYMHDTFKDHIAARKKLLQEVASQGTASSEVLDLAFSEPVISVNSPGGNDFSVKFKRSGSSMEMATQRPPTAQEPPPAEDSGPRSRRNTPIPGVPIIAAPIEPIPDDGKERKITDMIGPLPHAGAQPLIETDLARGVSGQIPIVTPETIAAALPTDREPTPPPSPLLAPKPPSARRAATSVPPPIIESEPRSSLGVILVIVALLAAGAFVVLHFVGGSSASEVTDDAAGPVRARKPVAAMPPAAMVAVDAGLPPPPMPTAPVVAPAVEVDAGVPEAPPLAPSDSEPGAEAQYQLAEKLIAKNDLPRALATLKHAQQLDPSFAPTWRALGQVLYKMGDHAAAKAAYQKYLQLAPNAADAVQIRGTLETL